MFIDKTVCLCVPAKVPSLEGAEMLGTPAINIVLDSYSCTVPHVLLLERWLGSKGAQVYKGPDRPLCALRNLNATSKVKEGGGVDKVPGRKTNMYRYPLGLSVLYFMKFTNLTTQKSWTPRLLA